MSIFYSSFLCLLLLFLFSLYFPLALSTSFRFVLIVLQFQTFANGVNPILWSNRNAVSQHFSSEKHLPTDTFF